MELIGKGMKFRWLNNAGFEVELSSGKHLLVDPWLDEAQIYPISIDEIERADYVLLTHTHDDHSDSIGRIQKRFPQAAIFGRRSVSRGAVQRIWSECRASVPYPRRRRI